MGEKYQRGKTGLLGFIGNFRAERNGGKEAAGGVVQRPGRRKRDRFAFGASILSFRSSHSYLQASGAHFG